MIRALWIHPKMSWIRNTDQNFADPQPWAQLSKDCCLIYNYVQVNKLAFFSCCPLHCLIFSHNQPFRLVGGDAHGQGGGMHRGGRGDARASCASPLGTPLLSAIQTFNPPPPRPVQLPSADAHTEPYTDNLGVFWGGGG
jgi:hypothetical protein